MLRHGVRAAYDGMHAMLPDDAAAGRQVRDILKKLDQKVLSSSQMSRKIRLELIFWRSLMPPPPGVDRHLAGRACACFAASCASGRGEATAGGGGGHGCSIHRFLLIKQDSSNNLEPLTSRSSKMVNKRSIIVRRERPCRAWQQNSLSQPLLGRFC